MTKKGNGTTLIIILCCGTSTVAYGQTQPTTSFEVGVQTPAPASASSVTDTQDIIVTAQKREQSLQKVPMAISVVQAAAFQERGITQLSQLPTLVPGFEFVRGPAQTIGQTFRGVGPQAGNVSFDSSIGMFIDGVFLGNNRSFNQTLFDIQRAEFIKGSQSSLLGKNSTVGALSIVNATPTDRFEGHMEAGAEVDDGGYYADAAINIPVGQDLAVRASGRYSYQRGYMHNVTTGRRGPTDTDWGGRLQVKYSPDSDFSALLAYQHTDNHQIGAATQCVVPGYLIPGLPGAPYAPGTPISAVCGDGVENSIRAAYSSDPRLHDGDDDNQTKLDMLHATLNYDLGFATITSITAGLKSRTFNAADFDFDNKDDNVWVRDEHYKQFTQELRLSSNDANAPIQYIVGAFYLKSRFKLVETHIWGIPDFPPGDPLQGQVYNGSFVGNFNQSDETISLFGQLTLKPVDRLTINIGGRYSHDKKVVYFGREPDYDNLTLWNTVIQAPFPYQRLDPAIDNLVSGSIAAQYQITPRTMIYASAARSGKAGGYGEFAGIAADPSLPLYNGLPQGNPNVTARVKPERANAYEIGIKSRLFDNMLTIDLAAFWTDIYNLQQLAFTGQFVVTNDRVRDQGAEVNFDFRPIRNLTLSGSATYAKVRDIRNHLDSVNAPRFSASGTAEYRYEINDEFALKLRAGFRHRSSKYNQLSEQEHDGEFTTLNFGVRLESDKDWFINANIENALNAKGANFGFPGPDPFIKSFKTLEPLRRIMLSVGTKF